MKIAVVTDNSCSLTEEVAAQNDIHVLKIPVIVDNQEYLDITTSELLKLQKETGSFPKTSQPSFGEAVQLFEKLHADGYEAIIAISLSSGISGFYNTLETLAHNNPEWNLRPFDSKITIRMQADLALAARKFANEGLDVDQVIEKMHEIQKSIDVVFVVDDLMNLSKGGRLSNASAFIGTMLHIKPLLTFEDGKIIAFEKIRSMKRALKRIQELLVERFNNHPNKAQLKVFVFSTNDQAQAEQIAEFIRQQLPDANIIVDEFNPIIAVHLGEKSLGISWMIDYEKA
ncbi:MAG: DegV family protein [Lactobacillus sp.]|nr:DegV family protein [Lactobacillus sp.]